MSVTLIAYRATVYAARSVDNTEATVLTPASGAAHSDAFRVATIRGVTDFQPYMGMPTGRRGRMDPLTKRTDVGEISIPLLDVKAGAASDNLTRWVTAFMGDAFGVARWMGLKVYVEESTDGGATWSAFFTGRINSAKLDDPLWYRLGVRDMGADLQLPVFVGQPHASATNAQQPSLLPVGLVSSAYGIYRPSRKLSATIGFTTSVTENGVTYRRGQLQIASASITRYDNVLTEELALGVAPATIVTLPYPIPGGFTAGVPNFTGSARVRLASSSAGSTGDFLVGFIGSQPIAGKPGVYKVNALTVQELPRMRSTDADPPNYMALPTSGVSVTIYVKPNTTIKGANPIVISDTHPVQAWQDMLNGYYGYLWQYPERLPTGVSYGAVKRSISYSTAFTDFIADNTYPLARFIITDRARMDEWIETRILQPYQLGYYLSSSGAVTPVDLRRPTTLPSLTITDADLAEGPQYFGWNQDRQSAVTRVHATYYEDWPLGLPGAEAFVDEIAKASGSPSIASLFKITPHTLELLDIGRSDMGDAQVNVDFQAFRGIKGESLNGQDRLQYLQQRAIELVTNLQQPYGAGAVVTTLRCRRTSNTGCQPGETRLLQVNALPDPATNKRGGTRLVRCTERAEEGPIVSLTFVDLGVSTTATVPVLTAPTLQVGSTQHGADVAVTLNTSTEPAEIHYAVTSSTVATVPSTSEASWALAGIATISRTVTADRLPAGTRCWMRGRTLPGALDALRRPSAWVQAGTSGYVDLAALAQPGSTSLTITPIDGYKAQVNWTNGSTLLQTEVRLSQPSTDTLTSIAIVMPGQTSYLVEGLLQATCYGVGVRHADALGGVSAELSTNFTTAAASTYANPPKKPTVLRGSYA